MPLCLCGESGSPSSPRSSAASAFNSSLESDSPPRPSASSAFSSLLPAFIAANYNITTLLADPRFTADEIMAFLESPETQAKLTTIAKVAHLGLTIRATEARHTAITALEDCTKHADDLIEKRRAAYALYRATASPLIPAPGARSSRATDTTTPAAPAAPPPPPPAPRGVPHPDFKPHDVIRIVSQSLFHLNNKDPEPGSGLATLNAFLTPDANVCGTQLPTEPDITTNSSTSTNSNSNLTSNSSSSFNSDSPLRHSDSSAPSAFSSPSSSSSSPHSPSSPRSSASSAFNAPPDPTSSPWPSVALRGESSSSRSSRSTSSLNSVSPLRSSDSSATSAFSSPSLTARRIEALRATPIGKMDGHVWYLRHNHDEVSDARVKVALWYVPNTGGERHFFFTLETKLFHFPDADPDCWYITSIEPFDAIPWHRARREAEAAAAKAEARNSSRGGFRDKPPDDQPAQPP